MPETPDPALADWNRQIIDEFRANQGQVGGPLTGFTLLLLHTTGAKTGQPRVNPLAYRDGGERLYIFGSYAGAEVNPAWFHNLIANPDATIEVGTETRSVRARVLEGDERDRIWADQVAAIAQFGEYQEKTDRVIPVIALEPA